MKTISIRNIRIKTKLIFLGGISILGMIFIGAESIITSRQINQASTDISQSWMPSVIIAEEMNTALSNYRNREYHHVISRDAAMMRGLEEEMLEIRREIDDSIAKYADYEADETDHRLMKEAEACWERYLECNDRLLALSRDNDTDEAMKLIIGESRQLFQDASDRFMEIVSYNREGAEKASLHSSQLYVRLARVKIVTICLVGIVIALLVIYVISAIDKPVEALVDGTRRVANGDLDVRLDYQSEDEIGILTDSMNQLIDRLKNIIDDEKYLFQEIGSENFEVKSSCEQAYRGDFAPILYSISSLMSRLGQVKEKQRREARMREQREERKRQAEEKQWQIPDIETIRQRQEESGKADGGSKMDATDKKS